MKTHLKRLLARLRPHLPPAPQLPPSILPVPSGGVVRVGRTLPSYQRYWHSTYIRGATIPFQCRRCQYLNQDVTTRGFLHCAAYPLGPDEDPCRDFVLIPDED